MRQLCCGLGERRQIEFQDCRPPKNFARQHTSALHLVKMMFQRRGRDAQIARQVTKLPSGATVFQKAPQDCDPSWMGEGRKQVGKFGIILHAYKLVY